jgi:hypothetical protein
MKLVESSQAVGALDYVTRLGINCGDHSTAQSCMVLGQSDGCVGELRIIQ